MSFRDAMLLRAAAVWTAVVWATFIRNIVDDSHRSTGFKVVHVLLAIASVLFALGIWAVASRGRQRVRDGKRRDEGKRKEKHPSS